MVFEDFREFLNRIKQDLHLSDRVGDDTSVHHTSKDVTKPGLLRQRTHAVRVCEEFGGAPLLFNPILNKGTNFTFEERRAKGLEGLLPPVYESLDLQAERVMFQIHEECVNGLQKYEVLAQVASSNTTLFYKVLVDNLVELAPIVYTPVVGEVCTKFDRIYRNPLGVYVSAFRHRNRFADVLSNWPNKNVQIIVVTDGGRILGLGDLGTNGIGISIGKISLYVAGGGFHPEHSLPIGLDVGTDRKELLEDKFYLGEKTARLQGDAHMEVMEEFCTAVKDTWPHCLVQFEDFQTERAFAILERFRDRMLCFNDDIQGTGAVVTTGFINGMKAQGTDLKTARVVFYGAGSSAVGVASMIASLLQTVGGLTKEDAYKAIYVVDSKGLVTTTRGDKLAAHKASIARSDVPDFKALKDIIAHVKPHALIGLSGAGPSFKQEDIEELCAHTAHPLVFPLSNPTSKAEITAADTYEWSKGSAIFAAGSPFEPYMYNGIKLVPGQANNVFIFPGVGFGSVIVKARTVLDEMLIAAAKALADYVTPEEIKAGKIYPDIQDLRKISAVVATAVAQTAFDRGIAGIAQPADLHSYILERMWIPGDEKFEDQQDVE